MRVPNRLGAIVCLAMMASVVSCSSSSADDAGGVGSAVDSTETSAANQDGNSAEQSGATSDSAAAEKGGKILYTGAQTGEVEFESITCATLNGDFLALVAPDSQVDADPKSKLALNHSNGKWLATLVPSTNDLGHSYVRQGADGVTAAEHDGVWVVTLSDLKLDGVAGSEVTANGTLTCTRVEGT